MPNRRQFLGAMVGAGNAVAAARPNIVYIMSDDHAAQAIGAYGSRINRTPNIDRIAREGMRFDSCFCTNSICTPSRASILTGKYGHITGVRTLDDSLDPSTVTFPRVLHDAGYYTGLVGKWHLQTDPVGFDYWNVLPGQGKYFDPIMSEGGTRKTYEGHVTGVLTDLGLRFLERRPKNKPFCLLLHHKAPHDMWQYDPKHAGLYAEDVPEPDSLYEDDAGRSEAFRRATNRIGIRHTEFPEQAKDLAGKARKHFQYEMFVKAYLRCIAGVDESVGRVLDYLDASGLRRNTIVVYTSDQGVFTGEHGLFDKRFMYEESLRMPLLVRYPGGAGPGSVNQDMVLNIDFAPTLLDLAGAPVPRDMQGLSFRPLLGGRTPRQWRSSMYYRYWMHLAHFNIPAHYGVRTRRHKLIHYYGQSCGAKGAIDQATTPEWEMFDLEKDPHEVKNVYSDPAYRKDVKELKAELARLRRQYRDHNGCGSSPGTL